LTADAAPSQRIDKWLWHARFFRTRTLAAKFADAGKVRLSRGDAVSRIEKSSETVRPGDVLTFQIGPRTRIIAIEDIADRRGSAPVAATLYEDRSPPPPPKEETVSNGPRPTKKQRRAIDAVRLP